MLSMGEVWKRMGRGEKVGEGEIGRGEQMGGGGGGGEEEGGVYEVGRRGERRGKRREGGMR